MKLRSIVAVVAGLLVWAVTFPLLAVLEAQFWPALAEATGTYFETQSYAVFNTAMLASFQVIWPLTNGAAGLVTGLIAKRLAEVWFLCVILFAYFAYNHLWALWDDLPLWYNLLVVVLVAPFILGGGLVARLLSARGVERDTATVREIGR
jgi:hypothetical protein